jgi:hypothetical protein
MLYAQERKAGAQPIMNIAHNAVICEYFTAGNLKNGRCTPLSDIWQVLTRPRSGVARFARVVTQYPTACPSRRGSLAAMYASAPRQAIWAPPKKVVAAESMLTR